MPPVTRKTGMSLTFLNTEYTHVYTYKCECGKDVTYYDYEKPEKLQKCFECQSESFHFF